MPNLNAPNGFVPSYHLHGGTVRYNGKLSIASALASNIFLGDAVIETAADGSFIDVAPVGGAIIGVFAGCSYVAANGDVVWAKQWVSGTATLGGIAAEAFVYTDPNIVYTCQVAGTIAATDIGEFADLVAGAGTVSTGVSGFELSATAGAGPAQFRIMRLAPQPDGIFVSEFATANPRVEVQIAEHSEMANLP